MCNDQSTLPKPCNLHLVMTIPSMAGNKTQQVITNHINLKELLFIFQSDNFY